MTRRFFLQAAANTILTMGFGGLFSSRYYAAAARVVRHLRQTVTAAPRLTRMIQWDSPYLPAEVSIEVRRRTAGRTERISPSYTYLDMDGETQYIFHAEIPLPAAGGSWRVTYKGGATDWITLPLPQIHAPVHALLFSDSQCGDRYDIWQQIYQNAWHRHPEAEIAALVGDLTDNGASAWHWRSFLDAMEAAGDPLAAHVHVPVLGNHEYYGLDWTAEPPTRYLHTFALPENGSTAFHGHYYAFDIGCVRCFVLDTQFYEMGARGAALQTEQLTWLRQAAEHRGVWNIVLMHKDILSYGDDQPVQQKNIGISDVGQIFLDVFDALGIDLVVSGHIHAYRRRRIRARQTDAEGTLYLLAGPAGNEYFDVPAESYDLAAAPNPSPSNYLYLEADEHRLRITCETADGTVLDTVEQHK